MSDWVEFSTPKTATPPPTPADGPDIDPNAVAERLMELAKVDAELKHIAKHQDEMVQRRVTLAEALRRDVEIITHRLNS